MWLLLGKPWPQSLTRQQKWDQLGENVAREEPEIWDEYTSGSRLSNSPL